MKAFLYIVVLLTLYISSCTNEPETVTVDAVELPETREFINFWKGFSEKFNSLDSSAVRRNTLDTVWLWGDRVSSTEFIKRYPSDYSDTNFPKIILDTNKVNYSSIGCHPAPLVVEAVKQEYGDAYNCQQATVNDTLGAIVNALEFTFLKTTKGYMLFGVSYYSYSWSQHEKMVDTTEPQK